MIHHQNPVRISLLPPHVPHAPFILSFSWQSSILAGQYKSWWSSLCRFPVTCSLLSPDIFLITLFLNIPRLCSSLNEPAQVSHPHKACNITILSILMLMFINRHVGVKIFNTEFRYVKYWASATWIYKVTDKSLAQPRRKQANVSVRMAWISFSALPCRKKYLMTAHVPDMLPRLFPSWSG